MPFKTAAHKHNECVDRAVSAAEARCAQRGLRLTKLRRRVLELIWGRHEPVKAYEVLDRLRDEHRGAAPPTVYRALDFLQKEGLVHRIKSLSAFVGCGEPASPHVGQFLICRDCGSVAEMDDADVTRLLAKKAETLGFQVDSATIEIKGLCSECGDTSSVSG
ncbi:MAG: transcriptional repressor [Gammaproteobacteria bacterium]|nr:transcriptional repressor [Gammaproteobacteria bacterium]MCI0591794.1 transcriptional repressor [Gammaproteobacteria bacterium]